MVTNSPPVRGLSPNCRCLRMGGPSQVFATYLGPEMNHRNTPKSWHVIVNPCVMTMRTLFQRNSEDTHSGCTLPGTWISHDIAGDACVRVCWCVSASVCTRVCVRVCLSVCPLPTRPFPGGLKAKQTKKPDSGHLGRRPLRTGKGPPWRRCRDILGLWGPSPSKFHLWVWTELSHLW